MANIRINDLPADPTPSASDVTAVDGTSTRKSTLTQVVDAGRPFASQAEAEAGTSPTKAMSPLTTAQAITALGGAAFAATAQGVPAGGSVNQVLGKTGAGDYAMSWRNAGAGDLLAAANLSDVANTATALGNLGGLSSALAASTYLTQASAASAYQPIGSYQPLAAALTSWAGVTRAAGFDTFASGPSSANLLALLTTKTGTGSAVFSISPALTGTPTAPTAAVDTNTTQIASTAMVLAQAAAATPLGNLPTAVVGTSTRFARADHVHPGREVLTANRTYYVRTDGSDSNTGLVNNAGGAFLTIQRAVNVAKTLDSNGFDVTISVGDGTRTVGAEVNGPLVGGGNLNIIGNTATPANCVINATSADCFHYTNNALGVVRGFKLTTTTSGNALSTDLGSYLTYGNMDFGACASAQVAVGTEANCFAAFNYTISGSAVSHFHTGAPAVLFVNPITITLTGTPAFSAYFAGTAGGYQILSSLTFVGSATGKRYLAHKNGTIDTFQTSETYLPGDVAGTTESGGKYVGDVTYADLIGSTGAVDGAIMLADTAASNRIKAGGDVAVLPSANAFSPQLQVKNTTNDANAAYVMLQKLRGAAAVQVNDTLGSVLAQGADSGGTLRSAAGLNAVATAVGASSVDGLIDFQTSVAGTFATRLRLAAGLYNASATGGDKGAGTINMTTAYYLNGSLLYDGAGLYPDANDGAAIGSTALQWSDLFLASGGVINFNNGDVSITHSADMLSFTGAASGWRFGAQVSPTGNDGTSLGSSGLAFSDLFLADGAVINFNAGNYTITHSAGAMAFSGIVSITGDLRVGAGPITKNADFTLAATESSIIVTKGSTCTATLGTATAGRRLRIKTTAAFTTVSASSNVVPRVGGAAGTAILAGVAGSWAELEGDGTNWIIMSGA